MKSFERFASSVTCKGVRFQNLLTRNVISPRKAWSTKKLLLVIIYISSTLPSNISLLPIRSPRFLFCLYVMIGSCSNADMSLNVFRYIQFWKLRLNSSFHENSIFSKIYLHLLYLGSRKWSFWGSCRSNQVWTFLEDKFRVLEEKFLVNTLICSTYFSKRSLSTTVQIILKIDITHSWILRLLIRVDCVSGNIKQG